jgi:hypothetical protein
MRDENGNLDGSGGLKSALHIASIEPDPENRASG